MEWQDCIRNKEVTVSQPQLKDIVRPKVLRGKACKQLVGGLLYPSRQNRYTPENKGYIMQRGDLV